jgi:uncharacterized membrane protein YedE/YeeE
MTLSTKISALLSGLIFGFGLIISGFFNPNNVLAFFNIFGNWAPGLMITFILSITISALAFIFIGNRSKSILGEKINLPEKNLISQKLFLGSCLFGIGWGLIGICPGPALVLLGSFKVEALYFFAGFIPGIFLINLINRKV